MDVVFNHTAEGNENGPILSFRGTDNGVYYMLAPKVQVSYVPISKINKNSQKRITWSTFIYEDTSF